MDNTDYLAYLEGDAQALTDSAEALHDVLMRFADQLTPAERYAVSRGRAELKAKARERRVAAAAGAVKEVA